MEQKESKARELFAILRPHTEKFTADEAAVIHDIEEGRAVTTGRLSILQEMVEKYAPEEKQCSSE